MIQTTNKTEIIIDDSFSYEGFQVVRGEFFAHVYEPSFTFNNYKVYVNTVCIKRFPDHDYIQILVNPETKKLAVKPCREEEKDSFRWCSATAKRAPKQITCRVFFAKVMALMNWDPKHRYKLLGKVIQSNNEILFVFELNSPEIYKRNIKENGKETISRIPSYPEEWKTQFGVPVTDHKAMQINTFDSYAIFGLQKDSTSSYRKKKNNSYNNTTQIQCESTAISIKEREVNDNESNTEQLALNLDEPANYADRPQTEPYQNTPTYVTPPGRT